MEVYIALRSSPDYTAPPPSFVSAHETLKGAIEALYPDQLQFQTAFRKWPDKDVWEGPDGFGLIRKVEVKL